MLSASHQVGFPCLSTEIAMYTYVDVIRCTYDDACTYTSVQLQRRGSDPRTEADHHHDHDHHHYHCRQQHIVIIDSVTTIIIVICSIFSRRRRRSRLQIGRRLRRCAAPRAKGRLYGVCRSKPCAGRSLAKRVAPSSHHYDELKVR